MDPGIWMLVITCLLVQQASLGSAIINGSDASPGEFKWMVSLQDRSGHHFCGGVVISHKAILTAAQCLYSSRSALRNNTDFKVLLGTHDFSQLGTSTIIDVRKFILHPHYRNTNPNQHFDIAVLELENSINTLSLQFQNNIAVIQLPKKNYAPRELKAMGKLLVLGWGFLADRKMKSTLQEARVPVLTYSECQGRYNSSAFNVISNVYCTDSTNVDICQGDTGGPLAIERKLESGVTHELVGIISMSSNGCAVTGSASIHSNVFSFSDFIQAEMRRIG